MKNDYKTLIKLSYNIFNTCEILLEYCKTKNEEDIAKILPVLEVIHRNADDLNFRIMKMKKPN